MTPEQAQQIDREEFEVESQRIRARVPALTRQTEAKRSADVAVSVAIPAVRGYTFGRFHHQRIARRPRTSRAAVFTIGAHSLTTLEWADLLGIAAATIYTRRCRLGSLEAAVALGGPGVGKDFDPYAGTGGGSTTQDFSEIEFSQ